MDKHTSKHMRVVHSSEGQRVVDSVKVLIHAEDLCQNPKPQNATSKIMNESEKKLLIFF